MASETVSSPKQAFSDLRQIIDRRREEIQNRLAQAVQQERYQDAEELAKWAREVADLRAELDSLAERLERVFQSTSVAPATEGGRLPKGLKTPQGEYRVPILQTLVELDGQADMNRVLERVRGVDGRTAQRIRPGNAF
ncbi:MAG: hypothetical protein ACOC6F_03740 [bacterium]